jgi:hypothetical protein
MDIKEYLREHPLISAFSIERTLGLPRGTIRLNSDRKIPVKYEAMILDSLSNYVAIREHVVKEKIEPISFKMPSVGKEYVLKKVKVGIADHAFLIGTINDQGNFVRNNNVTEGMLVILKE